MINRLNLPADHVGDEERTNEVGRWLMRPYSQGKVAGGEPDRHRSAVSDSCPVRWRCGGVWIGCYDCFKAAHPLNKSKYDCVTVRGE